MIIELCTQSVEDAILAYNLGIRRIELNSCLELGGISPFAASIEMIKDECDMEVVAMLRPRAGNFVYSQAEFDLIYEQLIELIGYGADGIAFGALNDDNSIDIEKTGQVIDLCHKHNKYMVFHRAFDLCDNINQVQSLINLKVDRLLTSGLSKNAEIGIENIRQLQNTFGKKIEILPACGINSKNAKKLMDISKCNQLHGSFSEKIISKENNGVDFGYYTRLNKEELKKVINIFK